MPFESERQRRWMHANKPEMAARWEKESGKARPKKGKRRTTKKKAR
jgi:hypothetical protein